jgi:hypothetical protein
MGMVTKEVSTKAGFETVKGVIRGMLLNAQMWAIEDDRKGTVYVVAEKAGSKLALTATESKPQACITHIRYLRVDCEDRTDKDELNAIAADLCRDIEIVLENERDELISRLCAAGWTGKV